MARQNARTRLMLFETRYFLEVFTIKDQDALRKLKTIYDKSKMAFVSSVSIYEIYKFGLEHDGKDVAELRANTIEKEYTVVDVGPEIAKEGADLSHRLRIPMADALIMATSKRLGVPCVTDDPHYSEVKRVWI